MTNKSTGSFDDEGHLDDLGVSRYAEALQNRKEAHLSPEVLAHVSECQQCRTEIMSLADLLVDVQQAPKQINHRQQEIVSWFQRIAAIFLLAGILGTYLWFLEQNKPAPAMAENFLPNPAMEAMVDDIYRSGEISIHSPEYQLQLGQKINFHWETTEKGDYTVVILDNTGNEIQRESTQLELLTINPTWPAGLYYWKLLNADDLLFVGKFQVGVPPQEPQ